MDKPRDTAPPLPLCPHPQALAPSGLQWPWLALPFKQRVLPKQLKCVWIPEHGSQSEGNVWPCQAHISRPKCVSDDTGFGM